MTLLVVVDDEVGAVVAEDLADVVYNAEEPVFTLFLGVADDDDGDILVAELELDVVNLEVELNDEF